MDENYFEKLKKAYRPERPKYGSCIWGPALLAVLGAAKSSMAPQLGMSPEGPFPWVLTALVLLLELYFFITFLRGAGRYWNFVDLQFICLLYLFAAGDLPPVVSTFKEEYLFIFLVQLAEVIFLFVLSRLRTDGRERLRSQYRILGFLVLGSMPSVYRILLSWAFKLPGY